MCDGFYVGVCAGVGMLPLLHEQLDFKLFLVLNLNDITLLVTVEAQREMEYSGEGTNVLIQIIFRH